VFRGELENLGGVVTFFDEMLVGAVRRWELKVDAAGLHSKDSLGDMDYLGRRAFHGPTDTLHRVIEIGEAIILVAGLPEREALEAVDVILEADLDEPIIDVVLGLPLIFQFLDTARWHEIFEQRKERLPFMGEEPCDRLLFLQIHVEAAGFVDAIGEMDELLFCEQTRVEFLDDLLEPSIVHAGVFSHEDVWVTGVPLTEDHDELLFRKQSAAVPGDEIGGCHQVRLHQLTDEGAEPIMLRISPPVSPQEPVDGRWG